MRHIFSSFMICLSLCCAHTSVALAAQDGKQPAASDPWQDATVTHINRMPMTAHYLPFTSENGALAQLKKIEFSQLLLDDFPCISIVMSFEVLNVFEEKIFRPVFCHNSTNIIE